MDEEDSQVTVGSSDASLGQRGRLGQCLAYTYELGLVLPEQSPLREEQQDTLARSAP